MSVIEPMNKFLKNVKIMKFVIETNENISKLKCMTTIETFYKIFIINFSFTFKNKKKNTKFGN